MPKLSSDPNAFIRPSPSGGTLGTCSNVCDNRLNYVTMYVYCMYTAVLGGVTRNTQEAILLCEGI